MTSRTRHWLVIALSAALGGALGVVSDASGWSVTTVVALEAGLIAVLLLPAALWVELAPARVSRRRRPG
jgi:hypothetical protein